MTKSDEGEVMKKGINVVLINGLTSKVEEHKIYLKDGNYGEDLRYIMFNEYISKYGRGKYGESLEWTPPTLVNELLHMYKMKDGYKSIEGFNDGCGMLRNPQWNFRWFTNDNPYGFIESPFILLNRKGTKSDGEPLYGDLFFEEMN